MNLLCPARIADQISRHQPELLDTRSKRRASVSLVMRSTGAVPEILFIQRAIKDSDPWSGQVAFPGGNHDPGDVDVLATARRETREEVGVSLQSTHYLGRLSDQQGRNNYHNLPLVISCFVFMLDTNPYVVKNYEVADSFWIGLDHLLDRSNRIDYQTSYSKDPYPGIQFTQGPVLWGLTYRFVQKFLRIIGPQEP